MGSIKITNRDRIFLLLLPALAAFIAYAFYITKKPNAQLKKLGADLMAANLSRPSDETIAQQEAARTNARRLLENARKELEPIRQALNKQMDSWQDRRGRLQAADALTVLWRRHDLTLLEQFNVPASEVGVTPLVERLQQQTRVLLNREFGPVLWEVRLEGGFHGMKSALEEISISDLPVIPVSLEMRNKPKSTTKLWTVRLWQ